MSQAIRAAGHSSAAAQSPALLPRNDFWRTAPKLQGEMQRTLRGLTHKDSLVLQIDEVVRLVTDRLLAALLPLLFLKCEICTLQGRVVAAQQAPQRHRQP